MRFSFGSFLSIALFFLCLFPYISLVSTPFDTQPYAIVFSFLVILLIFFSQKDIKIPILLVPYFIVLLYAFLMFMFNSNVGSGLRSLVGYASVAIISLAGFLTFKKVRGNHFIVAVTIWFIFGFLQLLINKEFGGFLISRLSTSETRGVTSLAVEPSYYSIMCIFFFILNDVFLAKGEYSRKTYRLVFFIIVMQMLFSRSGIGFVLTFMYLISKMFTKFSFVNIIKSAIAVFSLSYISILLFTNIPALQTTRLGMILAIFTNDPLKIFLSDASISDRTAHILTSILSFPFSYGLGFGLGNWSQYGLDVVLQLGGVVAQLADYYMILGDRIMSGWGTAIFELGIFGLFFLLSFVYMMRKGIKRTNGSMKKVYISSLITLVVTMTMAVPLAFPLFGYIIGVFVNIQLDNNYHKSTLKDKLVLESAS